MDKKRRIIRLGLFEKNHREIRQAAAKLGISWSKFARKAVLTYARRINK